MALVTVQGARRTVERAHCSAVCGYECHRERSCQCRIRVCGSRDDSKRTQLTTHCRVRRPPHYLVIYPIPHKRATLAYPSLRPRRRAALRARATTPPPPSLSPRPQRLYPSRGESSRPASACREVNMASVESSRAPLPSSRPVRAAVAGCSPLHASLSRAVAGPTSTAS